MRLFSLFKKKKGLKPLYTLRTSLSERIKQSGQNHYEAEVALLYEGKPMRRFTTNVKAHSRDHAALKVTKGLSLKLLTVKKTKRWNKIK